MRYLLIFLLLSMASVAHGEEVTLAEFRQEYAKIPQVESWLNHNKISIVGDHSDNYRRLLGIDSDEAYLMYLDDVEVTVWIDGWRFMLSAESKPVWYNIEEVFIVAKCVSEPKINHWLDDDRLGYYCFLPLYWHERLLKELVK